jgi:hypothetical protein
VHQLDIFGDARDVQLRNDLADAVWRDDLPAARAASAALQDEFAGDAALAPAERLMEHLAAQAVEGAGSPLPAADILQRRTELQSELAAAAHLLMGSEAAPRWLARQWCRLAERAQAVAWHVAHADAHAAALYVEAGAWAQVAEAVGRIESWRRIPQPLAWMTLARWMLGGADAGWPLLAEALLLAPRRGALLLEALAKHDAGLRRIVRAFEDELPDAADGEGWAWLPAWAPVHQPLLAGVLAAAQPAGDSAPEQAFGLVLALLRLERQGRHHEIVAQRRRLQGLSGELFAAYMRTR